MVSPEALAEFKKIWLAEYGEEISDEQAMEIGAKLLNLFDHIHRPIKKKWVEGNNENNNENETWKNLKNN